MPLVDAKCTNCGAPLRIDNTKDAAICQYCDSAFIVEKAINNYNITNNNTIHADVVNIYNGNLEKEKLLNNAKLLKKTGKTKEALDIYSQITNIYPDEILGYIEKLFLLIDYLDEYFSINDYTTFLNNSNNTKIIFDNFYNPEQLSKDDSFLIHYKEILLIKKTIGQLFGNTYDRMIQE